MQKTLNDLSFGLPVIVETTDEARNVAATTIQAHHRGHWTRCLIQAAGMLEAVHIIQQACYNFVMRRRVATLAPYTLSDKGPLSLNLRMQSVRPTLATESSTADEPLLLSCCCVRRSCESTRPPPAPRRRGNAPDARSARPPSSSILRCRMRAVACCRGQRGWWRPSSRGCGRWLTLARRSACRCRLPLSPG